MGGRKKPGKGGVSDQFAKCKEYHKLKGEILAPFIARLALEARFEEFKKEVTEEGSPFQIRPSTPGNLSSGRNVPADGS